MFQESSREWSCEPCGAVVDGDFGACWKCGASRDGTPDSDFVPAVRSVREELHCKHCGYFLRGLPSNRCPECGAEFDPDAADTVPEPRTHERLLNRPGCGFWLTAWLGAWCVVLVIGTLATSGVLDDIAPALDNPITAEIAGALLLSLLVAPLGFILLLLPKHRGGEQSGVGPTEQVADTDEGHLADASVPGELRTEQSGEDSLICPHCAEPIGEFDHFCPSCANPVTAHASIDPLGQVYSAGRAYYRAVSGRPKLVIVLGMWLILGPQIPFLLFAGTYVTMGYGGAITPASDSPLMNGLRLLIILAWLALYATILWRVTKHYQTSHGAEQRHGLGLCEQCGYDLRGTIAAGRDSCPECGTVRQGE